MCGINWPALNEYMECPGCEGKTDFFAYEEPDADADAMKRKAAFERRYREEWKPSDGEVLNRRLRRQGLAPIDWERLLQGGRHAQELEQIPTLEQDPS